MQTAELISQLRMQAKEIADADEPGWGNTMMDAANTLQMYVDAIDAIYNHNEAARAAVIMHFGTLHQTAPNAELSGPRPLAAEGSRSNDGLCHNQRERKNGDT